MWFGFKGFASVVYGLLVLESGIEASDMLFHLIAFVISIIARSSTDVAIIKKLDSERGYRKAAR
jgi:NhaP-type Na+/H+ and K+/H+ antiporter